MNIEIIDFCGLIDTITINYSNNKSIKNIIQE